jgi:hypothetical protein
MAIMRISASNTGGYGTKVQFGESGGTGAIRFGYSSHTVTAEPWRARVQEFGHFESANSALGSSNAPNLSLQQFNVPNGMSATRMDFLNHWTVAASTNGSITFRLALYTMSGSTLGTFATASSAISHSSAAANSTNTAGYSAQSGTQWRSVGLGTWAVTPGDYWLGAMVSIDGPAGTTGSMTLYGRSAISLANGALIGAVNPINHWAGGGVYSTGTASPPATIHISDVNRTGSYAQAQPGFRMLASF